MTIILGAFFQENMKRKKTTTAVEMIRPPQLAPSRGVVRKVWVHYGNYMYAWTSPVSNALAKTQSISWGNLLQRENFTK